MEVTRGDLVVVALSGDYGKPRPALVVQSDAFDDVPSVTVLPLSGHLQDAPLVRVALEPHPDNGLQKSSQIMVDKAATVSRAKLGRCIGRADPATMRTVDTALARFLGLAHAAL
jgi:mRNA interferase MazF